MKGLDDWITGAFAYPSEASGQCANGHEWPIQGTFELGAFWADDEEEGYLCPTCGAPDLDTV